jgi:aminoglycoside phosphotransferase (APT) family kinase protein
MHPIDSPIALRDNASLDLQRLEAFLRDRLPEWDGPLQLQQFPRGYSNLTYLVQAGSRQLVLRTAPPGRKARGAHDMLREYRILTALKPIFPYVPTALLCCEDAVIAGGPFYVMERLRGIILRRELPPGLTLAAAEARQLCHNLIAVLCRLHALDWKAAGLEELGRPEGYVRRQVQGWSQRFRDARTPDAPDGEAVMGWLQQRQPADSPLPALVHNDFKFDNVVLSPADPLTIVGVLDWEMATIGDPLMDLGASLAYWIQRDDPPEMQRIRTLPTTIDGMLTRRELVALYEAGSGRRVAAFDFYLAFGLFRLAVIAQQIYYRYYHGQSRDERFGTLIGAVLALLRAAERVMGGRS